MTMSIFKPILSDSMKMKFLCARTKDETCSCYHVTESILFINMNNFSHFIQ